MGQTKRDKDGNLLVRAKCSCCKQCWKFASGSLAGTCIYGGPFEGYSKQSLEACSVPEVQELGERQPQG